MKKNIYFILALTILYGKMFAQTPALDSSILAYYPFNGNANDESGNGFNATTTNATLSSDRFSNPNSAYSFDGSTQCIRLGDILDSVFARTPIAQFTITGWARSNTWAPYAGGGIIIGKLSGGGTNGYQWGINHDDNGKVRATIAFLNATNLIELESPSAIATNQWFNFTFTFDGTLPETERARLYIDTIVGSIYRHIGTIGTTTANTNQEVTIGAGHNFNDPIALNNQYNGSIDDIRIYNRVLSSSEIRQLYLLTNSTGLKHPGHTAGTIKVFPNPAFDGITISSDNLYTNTDITVKLTDIVGKTILTQAINQGPVVVDRQIFGGPGVYFIQIINESNTLLETRKLVIK